jgi:hypothetical protein
VAAGGRLFFLYISFYFFELRKAKQRQEKQSQAKVSKVKFQFKSQSRLSTIEFQLVMQTFYWKIGPFHTLIATLQPVCSAVALAWMGGLATALHCTALNMTA